MNSSIPLFYERRKRVQTINFTDRRTTNRRSNVGLFQNERRRLTTQIREHERESIRIPAQLKTDAVDISGFTQDIGLGGLKLLSSVSLPAGTPLSLQFSFGESVCFLNIAGQVIFCNFLREEETTRYAIGIKLSAVRELDQKILTIALQTLKQNVTKQEKSLLKIIVSNDTLVQKADSTAVNLFMETNDACISNALPENSAKITRYESNQIKGTPRIKNTQEVVANEKRKSSRILLRLPVNLNIDRTTYKAYVEDISPIGMLIASPLALPPSTPLVIQLSINENKCFMNISGRIASIRESPHHQNYFHKIGICFDNLEEPERNILQIYMKKFKTIPEMRRIENQPKVGVADSDLMSHTAIILIKDKADTTKQLVKRRVVITGIGVVAPNGIGRESFWKGLVEGKNCIDRISFFDPSRFPSQVAAEIRNFDPKNFIPAKEIKRMGRSAHLAVAAAQLAVADGNLILSENIKKK